MKTIIAMALGFAAVYALAPAYRPYDPDFVANYYVGWLAVLWGSTLALSFLLHIVRRIMADRVASWTAIIILLVFAIPLIRAFS